MLVRPQQKESRILGNRKCDGVTSVTFHPGNAASTSLRFTPRISGRLRFGHTSSSTVASDTVIAPTSRPIAARWVSFKSWKVPVSSTSRKPEPMPAARKSVTSPCTSLISTPACCTRSRARQRAFSTISIPVTCQPRFARWIPQMPLPVPKSSAAPYGMTRPFSSRASSSDSFAANGGSVSSQGWKPMAYASSSSWHCLYRLPIPAVMGSGRLTSYSWSAAIRDDSAPYAIFRRYQLSTVPRFCWASDGRSSISWRSTSGSSPLGNPTIPASAIFRSAQCMGR